MKFEPGCIVLWQKSYILEIIKEVTDDNRFPLIYDARIIKRFTERPSYFKLNELLTVFDTDITLFLDPNDILKEML